MLDITEKAEDAIKSLEYAEAATPNQIFWQYMRLELL
jgi:hypothetical protein